MLGLGLAEILSGWMLERLYFYGTLFGAYVWAGDAPTIAASFEILAKLAAAALVGHLVLQRAGQRWRDVGHLGFRPWALVVAWFPIVAGLTVFLSELDNLIRATFGNDGLSSLDALPDLDALVSNSWQGVALAVVIAPVVEELAFRGLILRGLLGRWPAPSAIFVSATLFALMHFNPAQFPIAFTLGAVLAWVYVRTRSLGLCILGHAINNSATYWLDAIPFEVTNYNGLPETPPETFFAHFHPWWFDLSGLAVFAVGLFLLHRLSPAAAPWRLAPPPSRAEPPLLTPPLLAGDYSGNAHCQPPPALNTGPSAMSSELATLVTSLAQRARAASLVLATAPRAQKDAALEKLADLIDASHLALMEANQRDLLTPEATALTDASRERLTLSEKKLHQLAQSVREVVALPDPVGETLENTTRPNGLHIRKVRVPIGVIAIIYEARPNVTVDCAILCLKSGNASILRGGKECFHTNMALAALIQEALKHANLPADAVQLVPTTDRAALNTLLKLDTLIHCVIPRGGENLIRMVAENSTIPVIKHYKGVCFVYVDQHADLAMAESIVVNAKASRPSVCNAAEQLLVHRAIADRALPQLARALVAKNVQLRCDAASAEILARENIPTTPATSADYTAEFLDYIIAVRVVDSVETAIDTINRDSSNHSDAIVTADEPTARKFLASVDSATVYWNASTRFTDGFEFGYGAEIGISTDRLHARGPMGLPELCSYKFLIEGTGQVR